MYEKQEFVLWRGIIFLDEMGVERKNERGGKKREGVLTPGMPCFKFVLKTLV